MRPATLIRFAALTLALALLLGCQRGPRPLAAGTDACEFCRMTVSDVRFGAEIVSNTGRVHTFDAIECLASFYLDAAARDDVRGVYVTDFESGRLLAADSALLLRGGSLRSPMGRSLAAFAPAVGEGALVQRYGGSVLRWSQVLEQTRNQQIRAGAEGHTHAHTVPGASGTSVKGATGATEVTAASGSATSAPGTGR